MHDHRSIQELAYLLWEARGRPHGSAEQDWLNAERQAGTHSAPAAAAPTATQPTAESVDDALKDSFPASDPPAAHRPDEPPVNADQKWQAAGRARTSGRPKATKSPDSSSAAKPAASPASAATGRAPTQAVATGKPGTRTAPKPKETTTKSAAGKKPPGSPTPKSP